jgi:2'-5' RNA ligase
MPAGLRRSRPPLPRYAVAWFPSFDGLARIERFRARHDPAARDVAAHLTLVFPFPTAHSRLQVETHVTRVVSRWPRIPVTFRRVRMHANEFLFLMVSRGASSVTALHDKLYTRSLAPHLRRDIAYEPHITVARHLEYPALEAALAEAEEEFTAELGETIREVTLLAVGPDGRISPLRTIPLATP